MERYFTKKCLQNIGDVGGVRIRLQPSKSFQILVGHWDMSVYEPAEELRTILQQYIETTPFSCNKVIERNPRHLAHVAFYESHKNVSILIRNNQTIEW